MAATDSRPVPIKNTAYRVIFPILDADGDLVTGATGLDSEVSKDCGTFTDCTNEATEIATSSGVYYLDLTSTEMNADSVAVIVKTTSSGAKTTPIVIYPQESGDIKVDVQSYGGTAGTFSGGRPEVNTTHAAGTAWGSGAITAASIAADAITDAKVASDVTIASVTGAVGSVTGNVGGNVVGSVASVTAGVTVTTNNDKTGYGLSSAAVQAIWDALTSALTTVGSIGKLLVDNINATISSRLASASYTAPLDAAGVRTAVGLASANLDTQLDALPTAAENADAVWDEATSGHTTAGTTGKALTDAGSAGDPWSTAVPGAYSAGTAGYLLGTNLDATVSSRLATSGYTAPLSAAGVRSAVGLASANLDTQLGDIPTATENADALLGRNVAGGSDGTRTVMEALYVLRNKVAVSGGALTVYGTDDATPAFTATVTTAAGDPVSGIDPA